MSRPSGKTSYVLSKYNLVIISACSALLVVITFFRWLDGVVAPRPVQRTLDVQEFGYDVEECDAVVLSLDLFVVECLEERVVHPYGVCHEVQCRSELSASAFRDEHAAAPFATFPETRLAPGESEHSPGHAVPCAGLRVELEARELAISPPSRHRTLQTLLSV